MKFKLVEDLNSEIWALQNVLGYGDLSHLTPAAIHAMYRRNKKEIGERVLQIGIQNDLADKARTDRIVAEREAKLKAENEPKQLSFDDIKNDI